MATTPVFGFRYPILSDAPNGPAGLENLARDVEAEVGRRGIVGRNQRTGLLTAGAVNARILSTTAAVVSGRTYRISAHMEGTPTVAGSLSQCELRYTTNNTEPTTASTIIGRALTDHRVATVPDTIEFEGYYHAGPTGTLRVALCGYRAVGAGNIDFIGSADYPITLVIEDLGLTKAVTGTVY